MESSEATTEGIRVRVVAEHRPDLSDPARGRWMFAYTVEIANLGDERVQLVDRHWEITDGDGDVAVVDGPGQPHAHLIGFGAAGEGMGLIRQNLTNPVAPWPARVAAARSASPLHALSAAAPPTYLLHGAADLVVPVQQSRRLASALAATGVQHRYIEVAGLGHVPPSAEDSAAAQAWIAGVLRSSVFADGFEAPALVSAPR